MVIRSKNASSIPSVSPIDPQGSDKAKRVVTPMQKIRAKTRDGRYRVEITITPLSCADDAAHMEIVTRARQPNTHPDGAAMFFHACDHSETILLMPGDVVTLHTSAQWPTGVKRQIKRRIVRLGLDGFISGALAFRLINALGLKHE